MVLKPRQLKSLIIYFKLVDGGVVEIMQLTKLSSIIIHRANQPNKTSLQKLGTFLHFKRCLSPPPHPKFHSKNWALSQQTLTLS